MASLAPTLTRCPRGCRRFQALVRLAGDRGSAWRIAKTLNDEGREGPCGGIWYDSTIRGRPLRGDGVLRNLAKIKDLEDQLRRIPRESNEPPAAPPALHPGMAEVYRNKVSGLRVALSDGRDSEALEAARALIDKVIISPPETDGDPPGIEWR